MKYHSAFTIFLIFVTLLSVYGSSRVDIEHSEGWTVKPVYGGLTELCINPDEDIFVTKTDKTGKAYTNGSCWLRRNKNGHLYLNIIQGGILCSMDVLDEVNWRHLPETLQNIQMFARGREEAPFGFSIKSYFLGLGKPDVSSITNGVCAAARDCLYGCSEPIGGWNFVFARHGIFNKEDSDLHLNSILDEQITCGEGRETCVIYSPGQVWIRFCGSRQYFYAHCKGFLAIYDMSACLDFERQPQEFKRFLHHFVNMSDAYHCNGLRYKRPERELIMRTMKECTSAVLEYLIYSDCEGFYLSKILQEKCQGWYVQPMREGHATLAIKPADITIEDSCDHDGRFYGAGAIWLRKNDDDQTYSLCVWTKEEMFFQYKNIEDARHWRHMPKTLFLLQEFKRTGRETLQKQSLWSIQNACAAAVRDCPYTSAIELKKGWSLTPERLGSLRVGAGDVVIAPGYDHNARATYIEAKLVTTVDSYKALVKCDEYNNEAVWVCLCGDEYYLRARMNGSLCQFTIFGNDHVWNDSPEVLRALQNLCSSDHLDLTMVEPRMLSTLQGGCMQAICRALYGEVYDLCDGAVTIATSCPEVLFEIKKGDVSLLDICNTEIGRDTYGMPSLWWRFCGKAFLYARVGDHELLRCDIQSFVAPDYFSLKAKKNLDEIKKQSEETVGVPSFDLDVSIHAWALFKGLEAIS